MAGYGIYVPQIKAKETERNRLIRLGIASPDEVAAANAQDDARRKSEAAAREAAGRAAREKQAQIDRAAAGLGMAAPLVAAPKPVRSGGPARRGGASAGGVAGRASVGGSPSAPVAVRNRVAEQSLVPKVMPDQKANPKAATAAEVSAAAKAPPKAPDGSDPTKAPRINKFTGLPFGYSPGDALPSGASADMQKKAAESVARQKSAVAPDPSLAYKGTISTTRGQQTPMAVDVRPSRPQPSLQADQAAARSAVDARWAKENEKYARTDAAFATGERRVKAEQAVRAGGADALDESQRKEFGKMYADTKADEALRGTAKVAAAPYDTMMKKRRMGRPV